MEDQEQVEDQDHQVEEQPVDLLGIISTSIHQGCMGLPQEIIDQIVHILRDNPRALKACSLTCKAMFASTRHLIHRVLCLTVQNNKSVLTRQEGKKLLLGSDHGVKLRFVSYAGERGILRYTQQVHIRDGHIFNPGTLLPHIHHFQSLDRVHTLAIEKYDAPLWSDYYNTCFVHFYPTLTSLTISRPRSRYRPLLQFALQFPNLENLCLEWLPIMVGHIPNPTAPIVFEQSPPLRGHLRLAGYGTTSQERMDFARELPNGLNFRSVELQAFFGDRIQHILDACAHTLEDLTIVPISSGKYLLAFLPFAISKRLTDSLLTGGAELVGFELGRVTTLSRLTLRVAFRQVYILKRDALLALLSSIKSLVFCEFVLELGRLPPHFRGPPLDHWGFWKGIDHLLEEKFARYGSFRFIIRTGRLYDREIFEMHVKEIFPLLTEGGRVQFETSNSIDKYWPL